jgi:hypothetical protein
VRKEIEFYLNMVRIQLNFQLQSDAMKNDIQQASIIQQSLLPNNPPDIAGYEIAGRSYPAEEHIIVQVCLAVLWRNRKQREFFYIFIRKLACVCLKELHTRITAYYSILITPKKPVKREKAWPV